MKTRQTEQETVLMKFHDNGEVLEIPVLNWMGDTLNPGMGGDLSGQVEPHRCDHSGMSYSTSLELYCRYCGVPLFLPPKELAYLDGETVDAMYELWRAAGWPAWRGGDWVRGKAWTEEGETLHPFHQLTAIARMPVRKDKLEDFIYYVDSILTNNGQE